MNQNQQRRKVVSRIHSVFFYSLFLLYITRTRIYFIWIVENKAFFSFSHIRTNPHPFILYIGIPIIQCWMYNISSCPTERTFHILYAVRVF